MNRLTFPLLRSEIILEPRYQPGLGHDHLRYVANDPVTGAELWLSETEGHILRAAQQLRGQLGLEAIADFVKLHFETEIGEKQIAACLQRLRDLQWLATDIPRAELREAYWQTRQNEQSARKLDQLRASIQRMREEVPYYRALFAEQGLSEADIRTFDDLKKFPRLGKAQLREQFEKLHPDSLKEQKAAWGELVWRSSSGSTGPRTQTVAGADNYAYTLYETLGAMAPRGTSRQCLFIPPACTGATCHMETSIPYQHRILFGNTLLMNAFRNACSVTDAVMEEYVQEIERFKPIGLMGAGSYIYPLARYLKRTGRKVPKIEFIHLHVEVCSRIHRQLLEEVFECPVHGCYVSSEMGFAAVQCAHGNYHVGRGFHLEILANGQPAQPGQMGRLVATTLTTFNRLTPLLRFELGDLAIAATKSCSCAPMGGSDVIASIEGRLAEVIVTKDRQVITPRAVDNAITGGPCSRNIAFYDLVQEKNGRYLLELVADDKQAGFDESGLLAALKDLLGSDAEIEIQQREEIMPTMPAGRYRLCYSKMEQNLEGLIEPAHHGRTMKSIEQIRADFPQLAREIVGRPVVYFDNAATSLKPASVLDAMGDYYRLYSANIHRGKHLLSEEASAAYEASRETLAKFINAKSLETIFVRGATEGIGIVAAGLELQPDENVVGTILEHHSNILPWRGHCEYRGAMLQPDGQPDLAAAEALIDERTRLVTVTLCSNVTGVIVDVKPWAAMAHRHGLPLLVDAAQCGGHLAIDVAKMDCDFLVISGHKMFGPTGSGILYGKRERLDALRPPTLGGGTVNRVHADYTFDLRDLPWRLEAGTPDIAAVIGLGAAVEYIQELGQAQIDARTHELTDILAAQIDKLPGVRTCSPAAGVPRTSLISFTLESDVLSPDYIARLLSDSYGIMVRGGHHCAHPLHAHFGIKTGTVRASLHVYNTEEEIEYFGQAFSSVLDMVAVGGRVGI